MEPFSTEAIVMALLAIVAIYLVFRLFRFLLKFLALLAIGLAVFLIFFNGQGLEEAGMKALLGEGSISEMKKKLCQDDTPESYQCDCIATPVFDDLNSRFTKAQLREMEKSPEKIRDEIKASLKNRKTDIKNCIVQKKGSGFWQKLTVAADQLQEVLKQSGPVVPVASH